MSFSNSGGKTLYPSQFFPSSDVAVLNYVACTGSENSLAQCSYYPFNVNSNCLNGIAGVRCCKELLLLKTYIVLHNY